MCNRVIRGLAGAAQPLKQILGRLRGLLYHPAHSRPGIGILVTVAGSAAKPPGPSHLQQAIGRGIVRDCEAFSNCWDNIRLLLLQGGSHRPRRVSESHESHE